MKYFQSSQKCLVCGWDERAPSEDCIVKRRFRSSPNLYSDGQSSRNISKTICFNIFAPEANTFIKSASVPVALMPVASITLASIILVIIYSIFLSSLIKASGSILLAIVQIGLRHGFFGSARTRPAAVRQRRAQRNSESQSRCVI